MIELRKIKNEEVIDNAIDNLVNSNEFCMMFVDWIKRKVEKTEMPTFEKKFSAKFVGLTPLVYCDGIKLNFESLKIENIKTLVEYYEDIFEGVDTNKIKSIECAADASILSVDGAENIGADELYNLEDALLKLLETFENEIDDNSNYSLDYYTKSDIIDLLECESIEVFVNEKTGEVKKINTTN